MNPKYYQWIPIVGIYFVFTVPFEELKLTLFSSVPQGVYLAFLGIYFPGLI